MLTETQAAHVRFSPEQLKDWRFIAAHIDHTLLKPEASPEQITQLCAEAAHYQFASVCVNPANIALAYSLLHPAGVKVCTVIGFPLGASTTRTKRFEADDALRLGAEELDMVINVAALRANNRTLVHDEVRALAEVAHSHGAILKVIIETSLLSLEQKIVACQIAQKAGADFVKTSTGFNGGGATVDDIHLMRGVVGHSSGVKASGGVRNAADTVAMLEAGATRIGTSSGVKIVQELGAPAFDNTPVTTGSY